MGDDVPFANLTAERLDSITYTSINWGNPQQVPKLGWKTNDWYGTGVCTAATQEAADQCAQNNQLGNALAQVTMPTVIHGSTTPQLFYNQDIGCAYTCPDKLLFNWMVSAGGFTGMDQGTANARAQSQACKQANKFHICLSDLPTSPVPSGTIYGHTIYVSGAFPPYNTDIVGGALPPGILPQGIPNGLLIFGTPTTGGTYNFTVRAMDKSGNSMQKNYTIVVTATVVTCDQWFSGMTWSSFGTGGAGGGGTAIADITGNVITLVGTTPLTYGDSSDAILQTASPVIPPSDLDCHVNVAVTYWIGAPDVGRYFNITIVDTSTALQALYVEQANPTNTNYPVHFIKGHPYTLFFQVSFTTLLTPPPGIFQIAISLGT